MNKSTLSVYEIRLREKSRDAGAQSLHRYFMGFPTKNNFAHDEELYNYLDRTLLVLIKSFFFKSMSR